MKFSKASSYQASEMPRYSNKLLLQRDLYHLFLASSTLATSSNEADDALEYLILSEGLKDQRYLFSRSSILKSNWAVRVLPTLSDDRYRGYLRMSRISVQRIVDLIRSDSVFQNNSNIQQAPVESQLQCALYKLGHDGSGSGFLSTATFWGVSEGHVFDCTKRVVEALCRLRNSFIKWPTARARTRESLANDTRESGFIGVVGKVDGTDIVLSTKPGGRYDGELFFNRKKRYALDLCAVCDSDKRFIYFLSGWPNSQHDQRIFAAGDLNRNPHLYFSEGQYLLGDSAYTNSRYLVTPYKAPHTRDANVRKFNRRLSRIRIDIEHTFGILKGRWKSLTGLRLRIRNKKGYIYAIRWITACVVLHNVLLDMHDEWEEEEGWWTSEEEAHDEELKHLATRQMMEGILKREQVKDLVLNDIGR